MESPSSIVEHHDFLDVFLQPFSFKQRSRVSCPRELRKARQQKVRQWRKPRPMSLVSRNLLSAKKTLRKIRVLRTAQGIKSRTRVLFRQETGAKQQPRPNSILKSGDKMTLDLRAPGNWCAVVNLQVQGAPGNWCEVMTVKKGQSWNSTICKSPTIDTLRKELAEKVESRRRSTSNRY